LEIEPGAIVAVLGANGAGKTTLLNVLGGWIRPESGQVLFDGESNTPGRDDFRRRFAFLPDVPPVPGNWTPLRFIGTTLKLYERPSTDLEERVIRLLEELDLQGLARWPFRRLSRGQIYKSILAAFLAADPEAWFLDEPFASGMDPRGLNRLKDYAWEASKRGHTILYTTQIVEVAEQFATRICVLDQGKVRAYEEPAVLQGKSGLEGLLGQLHEKPVV
jgi:ABC-2 type transport system ATP-binding protein